VSEQYIDSTMHGATIKVISRLFLPSFLHALIMDMYRK